MGALLTLLDAGAGAPLPTPPVASGLRFWIDPSDTATIANASGGAAQVGDLSGNGHHAAQGTAAHRPSTGARTINGLNALGFDAANDHLILPPALHALGAGNTSLYLVAQLDSATVQTLLVNGADATTNRMQLFANSGSGNVFINYRHSGVGNQAYHGATGDLVARVFTGRRNGTVATPGRDAGSTGTATASNAILTSLTLGNAGGSAAFALGEVLFYDRFVSGAENTTILDYLKSKWATP